MNREDLKRRHCWWDGDRVPGEDKVTQFRRQARAHQCQWREHHGLAAGYLTRGETRYPNGAKLAPTEENRGPNLCSEHIVEAVRARLAVHEHGQTLKENR